MHENSAIENAGTSASDFSATNVSTLLPNECANVTLLEDQIIEGEENFEIVATPIAANWFLITERLEVTIVDATGKEAHLCWPITVQ